MPKKAAATQPEEVTVESIFGPGGQLEKRHPGYEFRRSQLEMAKIADEAFQKHQHVVIEAGTGTGKTLAYLIPAIPKRAARDNFHGDEVAAGAAVPKRRPVSAKVFRSEPEGRADERPLELFVSPEGLSDGGAAGSERHGRN